MPFGQNANTPDGSWKWRPPEEPPEWPPERLAP